MLRLFSVWVLVEVWQLVLSEGIVPDISCIMAPEWENAKGNTTKEKCLSSVDDNGLPCHYCDSAGCGTICLTGEQMGIMLSRFGYQCSTLRTKTVTTRRALDEQCDDSCTLSYDVDPSKEGCESTIDRLGNPCTFCGDGLWGNVCLSKAQVAIYNMIGFVCPTDLGPPLIHNKPAYDPTCMAAYLNSPTLNQCLNETTDCYFCGYGPGALYMCLDEDQAREGMEQGLGCIGPDGLEEETTATK